MGDIGPDSEMVPRMTEIGAVFTGGGPDRRGKPACEMALECGKGSGLDDLLLREFPQGDDAVGDLRG